MAPSISARKLANTMGSVVNPNQNRCRYAADNRLMKNRSPRLVTSGRNPRRSRLGYLSSQSVIVIRPKAMEAKNIAVGHVHAIQLN